MAFLFNRSKSRNDLARPVKDLVLKLTDSSSASKAGEELARLLAQIKSVLQGPSEPEGNLEAVTQLVNSMIQEDLLFHLASNMHLLPFEARKDTGQIFSCVLRFQPSEDESEIPPAMSHIVERRPEVILALCQGYDHQETALTCGSILVETLKYEYVTEIILYDEPNVQYKINNVDHQASSSGNGVFWHFFDWMNRGSFEVSTDAFKTFREILTRHKNLTANYMHVNFDLFFDHYNSKLVSSNSYVTKRQTIKLLGELLLDRTNYNVMMAYVDQGDHLKLCMNLLRDDRKMVQYEGFHVFKVFVANPNKSMAVQKILINNRERLLKFLPTFLTDRTEDEQFLDEKNFLIRQIQQMPATPVDTGRG